MNTADSVVGPIKEITTAYVRGGIERKLVLVFLPKKFYAAKAPADLSCAFHEVRTIGFELIIDKTASIGAAGLI